MLNCLPCVPSTFAVGLSIFRGHHYGFPCALCDAVCISHSAVGILGAGQQRHSLHHLIEGLAFLDHAEVFAGMLLDGAEALLQVLHLRIECGIALPQSFVFQLL